MIPMEWRAQPPLSIVAQDYFRLADRLGDTRQPLSEAVHRVMIPSIQENFRVGGRPSWAPLTPFTKHIARKMDPLDMRPIGADHPILDRARGGGGGRLGMKNIVARSARWKIDGRRHVAELRDLPPTYQYARFHQTGYRWRSPGGHFTGSTPARPWALFQNEDINKIEEIFARWVTQQAWTRIGR